MFVYAYQMYNQCVWKKVLLEFRGRDLMMVLGSIYPLLTEDLFHLWAGISLVVDIHLYTAFENSLHFCSWPIAMKCQGQCCNAVLLRGVAARSNFRHTGKEWFNMDINLEKGLSLGYALCKKSIVNKCLFVLSPRSSDISRLFIVFSDNFIDKWNRDVHLTILYYGRFGF